MSCLIKGNLARRLECTRCYACDITGFAPEGETDFHVWKEFEGRMASPRTGSLSPGPPSLKMMVRARAGEGSRGARSGPGMCINSDRWIRENALKRGLIEPFSEKQIREGVVS